MPGLIVFVTAITVARANLYQECAKLYNPNNYMHYLPSLHLPYMGYVPIPDNTPKIKPTPVVKTKAVSIVTKYVFRNPVCVKYSKSKNLCKQDNSAQHKGNAGNQIVTKEYFVADRKKELGDRSRNKETEEFRRNEEQKARSRHHPDLEDYNIEDEGEDYYDLNSNLQSSEDPRQFSKVHRNTPHLTKKQIHDMLIEDRLDQLETILPHYTRRRIYETSTITITKVISNRRTMATLIVKNCIPQGYELCPPKRKKRKSKVAQLPNNPHERNYFG